VSDAATNDLIGIDSVQRFSFETPASEVMTL